MRETRSAASRDGEPRPYAARAPEGATFEAVRVGGRRRWPPILVLAFVALTAGMVAIGIGNRDAPAAPAVLGSPIGQGSPAGTSGPGDGDPDGSPVAPGSSPAFSPDMAPVVTNGSGPIVIHARRHPETMYVHGDVFVERVTWVFVSLQDASSRIAGWASVSIPGAAGPGVDDGPTLRFDVELALPAELNGGSLWIQVNAHDSAGQLIATTRLEIDRDGRGPAAPRVGFRPGVFFPLLDATWEDVR